METHADAPESEASHESPAFELTIARSGGFAGLTRTWHVTVSDDSDAATWRRFIDACPWQSASSDVVAPTGADRFVYRITVVANASDTRRATLTETAAEGPWHELIEQVKSADSA